MHFVPKRMFLTKGVGRHREQLTSFELALRDAGIASFNLVSVSSIFPPNCKLVPRARGLKELTHGEIVYSVISRADTNEPQRLVGCSIGVAIPANPERFGYLSEHHAFGQTAKKAGDYAEDLAAQMLGSTLGLDIDLDKLIVTPHIAWAAREARQRAVAMIARCIESFLTGGDYGRVA